MSLFSRSGPTAALAALLVSSESSPAFGQNPVVSAAFDTTTWVTPRHAIALAVDSATTTKGRIVILVGTTDVTALFRSAGDTLRYQPNMRALPVGEQRLTVHAVSEQGDWSEVASFPLRVLTPRGYEQGDVVPRLTVNLKGQVAEGHGSPADAPPRGEYQDLVIATGLQTVHRRNGWTAQSQLNVLGASNRQEALRFGALASSAPKFDLADYKLSVSTTGASITLGEQSFGDQRHLVNAFGSRGIGAAARLGNVGRLSFAALNGSGIVGWANPVGLANPDHRVVAGALGIDLVPRQPDLVRLDVTTVAGSVLPTASFNQGVISSAERNDGSGVRLLMRDPSSRVQIDAGFSRSRSDLPDDSTLAQDLRLTGVKRTARNARYVDASYQLIRSARITKRAATSLSIALKHERVDPLYRSMSNAGRPDVQTDAVDLHGTLGTVVVRGGVVRMRDNLGRVASILTTRTRGASGAIALPLSTLSARLSWLPTLSYDMTRTNQAGDGVPPNSEFAATHVPDQVSRNQNLSVDWQRTGWQAGYRLNLTRQDNRQPGREGSDFSTAVHNAALGITGTRLSGALDLGYDAADRDESAERTVTTRIGTTIEWRLTGSTVLNAGLTRLLVDRGDTSVQRTTEARAELSQRLPVMRLSARSAPAQLFVRYSRQAQSATDPLMAPVDRRTWFVNTGLTLGVF